MGQASACAAWSCELPVVSHPTEACVGPQPGRLCSPVRPALQGLWEWGKVTMALGMGKVTMAFPREGARDMGNGHLAPHGASPSAICNSVLSPWYRGAAGASPSPSPPIRAGGSAGG